MATVIIYGPQGCGKTRHAKMLKQRYGCKKIVDGWDGRNTLPPDALALTNEAPPFKTPDALALTNEAPPFKTPDAKAISFEEAMKGDPA